jgi:tripartite-type tricarboxylate transporter receptor subunit TctC
MKRSFPWLALLAAALCAGNVCAQAYPSRVVRLVVPSNPGGATDVNARLVAPKLGEQFGHNVLVENRTDATAFESVARAAPDGYTLIAVFDNFTTNPYLYKHAGYDPVRDFTPIAMLTRSAQVVVVTPGLGVRQLDAFVKLARAKGDTLNCATAGPGTSSRLTAELFKAAAGINPTFVHYKGGNPAMTALLGAQVDMMIVTIGTVLPHLNAGKLVPLAVTSSGRHPILTELPTVASYYPGFETQSWVGILGPAGLPKDIVARLNAALATALAAEDVRKRLQGLAYEIVAGTPDAFADWIRVDAARWGRIIRERNITLE